MITPVTNSNSFASYSNYGGPATASTTVPAQSQSPASNITVPTTSFGTDTANSNKTNKDDLLLAGVLALPVIGGGIYFLIKHFGKKSSGNNEIAETKLVKLPPFDMKKNYSLEEIEAYVKQGNADAQYLYAYALNKQNEQQLETGVSPTINIDHIVGLLEKSAKQKQKDAIFALAGIHMSKPENIPGYFEGKSTFKPDIAKGIKLLEKSAQLGNVDAAYNLSELYALGNEEIAIKPDDKKAYKFLKLAYPEATEEELERHISDTKFLAEFDRSVEKAKEERKITSFEFFQEQAKKLKSNEDVLRNLEVLVSGASQEERADWYYRIAQDLRQGNNIEKDSQGYLAYMEKAAAEGHQQSYVDLVEIYLDGNKDLKVEPAPDHAQELITQSFQFDHLKDNLPFKPEHIEKLRKVGVHLE